MYPASNAVKTKFKSPVQQHFVRGYIGNVSFTGENVLKGSLSWDNQCATEENLIGMTYAGRFQATFINVSISQGNWQGKKITLDFGISMGQTVEWIPCGEWYISEASHTKDGVRVTAYDAMLKLDEPLGISTTNGKCWDFLGLVIANTGVQLGMTEAQCDALPNGTQILTLDPENGLETKRDMLSAVGQYTGTYATIGRDGKLVLRQWQTTPCDTLTTTHRLVGAEFSDFTTYYSGVSVVIKKDEATHYYGDLVDDTGLTYNMGTNPFLQNLGSVRLETIMRNVLAELEKIQYTPFGSDIIDNPLYDLGDVITFTDGFANTSTCCVMSNEVQFHNATALDGFGRDPALWNVKSKTDKDIAGLAAETKADVIQYYTYTNAQEYVIGNNAETAVVSIVFLTMGSTHVSFTGEILVDVDTQDTLECEVKYVRNGVTLEYKPKELWIDGRHILSLFMPMDVEPNAAYTWTVYLKSSGGTITVPARSIQAMIWGQGLVASDKWDGYIDLEDTIGGIDITRRIAVATFTDDVEVEPIEPHEADAEDTISGIDITRRIAVAEIDDTVYMNKTSLELEEITWGDLEDAELTWGEVEEAHLW